MSKIEKKLQIYKLVACLLGAAMLVGVGFGLAATGILKQPKSFSLSTKILPKKKIFPKKKEYVAQEPKPIEELKVVKLVEADEGGELEVIDSGGIKATLYIPPGALKEDTEVTLAPLAEVPIEGYNDASLGNGVFIGPEDLDFDIPSSLIFDFDIDDLAGGLGGFGGFDPSAFGGMEGLEDLADRVGELTEGLPSPSPTPAEEDEELLGENTVIIFSNSEDGTVSVIEATVSEEGTTAMG